MFSSHITRLLAVGVVLSAATEAGADAVYTVTDLGTGTVSMTTDANGQGVVSNGQAAYPFQATQNALSSNLTTGFPNPDPPLVRSADPFGDSRYAFSLPRLTTMNDNGLAAGVVFHGVGGHWTDTNAFYLQRQPDGSWGSPVNLWSGTQQWFGPYGAGDWTVSILGINHQNQILGTGPFNPYGPYSLTTAYLFDLKTLTKTALFSMLMNYHNAPIPPGQRDWPGAGSWFLTSPGSALLDDQGRLLLSGTEGEYGRPAHTLLLTPQGVLSPPIAAPEPSTLLGYTAVLGVILLGRRLGRAKSRLVATVLVDDHEP